MVDESDRIGLGVPVVDLERPDAGRIINGSVLLIALGMDLTNPRAARKPVQAIVPDNAIVP